MDIKVGDKVRYELSWWGKPRWIGNRDRGGSGYWEEGTVITVTSREITVEGKTGKSIWPLEGHPRYDFLQWSWAGYLVIINSSQTTSKQCVCGAASVYGANTNLHSDWCDIK